MSARETQGRYSLVSSGILTWTFRDKKTGHQGVVNISDVQTLTEKILNGESVVVDRQEWERLKELERGLLQLYTRYVASK